LGEQFLKKRENSFKARGDRSKKALEAPDLLRNKPEILATDLTLIPSGETSVQPSDRVHLESTPDGLRVVDGNVPIGTIVDAPPAIREAVAKCGVVAAVVHARSAFGGITIRIREEEDDAS